MPILKINLMDKVRTPKNIFVQGAISPEKIATSIANHSTKTEIGGHSIFLGQVRADQKQKGEVVAIEYTAYEEMALQKAFEIREAVFAKYPLTCLHIYHSLGNVKVGEICIFVFVSAPRRKQVYEATEWLVNQVKTEVPIFGKEIFENEESQWKVNS